MERDQVLESIEKEIGTLKTIDQKTYAFQRTAYYLLKKGFQSESNEYLQKAIQLTKPNSIERAEVKSTMTLLLMKETLRCFMSLKLNMKMVKRRGKLSY